MDNERHAIEAAAPPAGYALAFNGEPIKKCCEACTYYDDISDSYQPAYYVCDWNNGNNGFENLKSFPFKNGCKHFVLHHTYSVDWEAVAREMEAENRSA